MENFSRPKKKDDLFELPPGFRFHPTDEELITHYLSQKALDSSFSARAIAYVDLNRVEPWDLPWRAKMGESEWYFFCVRDRKYPTGLRTNRATDAGYWKATGRDKEIFQEKALIGMKKTLVFYRGRAPKGEKTNWVMHEYRLENNFSVCNLPKTAQNEWVICRVFRKGSDGKKISIPEMVKLSSSPSLLPPLMDPSPYQSETKTAAGDSSHVTCFSDQKTQDDVVDSLETPLILAASSSTSSKASDIISPASWNSFPNPDSPFPDDFLMQDQSVLRMLAESNGTNGKQSLGTEFSLGSDFHFDTSISSVLYSNNEMVQKSFGNPESSSASAEPVDFGCLWNY